MSITTAEFIQKTEDIIRQYGWAQKTYGNTEIGFCVMGALGEAYHRYEPGPLTHYAATVSLHQAIRARTGTGGIAAYNDSIAASVEDVYLLFKDAKALAEGGCA